MTRNHVRKQSGIKQEWQAHASYAQSIWLDVFNFNKHALAVVIADWNIREPAQQQSLFVAPHRINLLVSFPLITSLATCKLYALLFLFSPILLKNRSSPVAFISSFPPVESLPWPTFAASIFARSNQTRRPNQVFSLPTYLKGKRRFAFLYFIFHGFKWSHLQFLLSIHHH